MKHNNGDFLSSSTKYVFQAGPVPGSKEEAKGEKTHDEGDGQVCMRKFSHQIINHVLRPIERFTP